MTDRERFEAEALPHLPSLARLACRLVRNETDAEDLVQETMLKAFRSWHRYELGTNVRAWLFTILRNTFNTAYRRSQRAFDVVDLAAAEHSRADGSFEADPERVCFAEADTTAVTAAMRELPPSFRDVIELRYGDDLQYAAIARRLEIPVGTVRSRLSRARHILAYRLRDYAVASGYRPAALAVTEASEAA